MNYSTYEVAEQVHQRFRWMQIQRADWLATVEDLIFEYEKLGQHAIEFYGDYRPCEPKPTPERLCLQCNESEAAIRASQRAGDPLYCAIVDYFGECEVEFPRHRFRDNTDAELSAWGILPRYWHKYRRTSSGWEIQDQHRVSRNS